MYTVVFLYITIYPNSSKAWHDLIIDENHWSLKTYNFRMTTFYFGKNLTKSILMVFYMCYLKLRIIESIRSVKFEVEKFYAAA